MRDFAFIASGIFVTILGGSCGLGVVTIAWGLLTGNYYSRIIGACVFAILISLAALSFFIPRMKKVSDEF